MSIARNTALNVTGAAVPIAVTLVTVPIYLSVIGIERYGILSIAWLLLGYFGLFDLGLGRAATQRIARLANASSAERSDVFWTALWLSLALGLVGTLLILPVCYLAFAAMEDVSGALAAEARAAVPWIAAALPVATVSGLLSGALQGRERFLALNVIVSLGTTLSAVSPLLVAIHHGPELSWLIAAALSSRVLTSGLLFYRCRMAVPLQRPSVPKRPLIRDLLSFGGWITVSSTVGPLLATFDRFVIGAIVGAAAITHYVIPFAMVSRVSILPRSLSGALFPKFALFPAAEVSDLKLRALHGLALVMTPVVLVCILAVEPFLIVWLGADFAAISAPVAHLLLLGVWINAAARIPHASLQGSGRPDLVAKAHIAELVPYMGVLALAIHAFGVEGAALAWTLRVAADTALLFQLDGSLKPAFRMLAYPALLVASAAIAVLSFPLESIDRWIVLGVVVSLATAWWMANLPSEWRRLWDARMPSLRPRS